ncbi:phosphoribosylanthranilate isomerase [Clostridium folliculivorans]|uniref:N-(5'-phosphoribosyl)anthranilate isomerase n=1 Tax=Clostridium folliculivorans TaxID=2886038 RepID=A0A9W6DB09_9CLOT|nr:phosphoribosylanthranilate isomerase [Clostridium folliculivorans]GKU25516.1 N-(5'-phosphoribosyl)anthranilate isomerase [Clostridium folliculivorans]GKU28539.1 N-(5'-phosphoribosyl)anthranilate isomerase [Clostridium folliculivorans]
MSTLIKVCGIRDLKTARFCSELGVDALGFVFCKSIRKITPEEAKSIITSLPKNILKIGVFMDNAIEEVRQIRDFCGLDVIQLHGDEDIDYCKQIKSPYIKAFKTNKQDFDSMKQYDCFGYLVDSPKDFTGDMIGKVFDWTVIKNVSEDIRNRIILAGGLNSSNVVEGIKAVTPFMVDVSSGVETNRVKDLDKIETFIRKVRDFEEN